jgi:hypothetical protein
MEEEKSLTLRQKVEQSLTQSERSAYEKYERDNKPPLSPKTASEFFELFLQGSSCEEISKLNPAFGLGIIVKARFDYQWDIKKEEYITSLFSNIKEKIQKNQLEAIEFSALSMSVFHKLWSTKFKKFLQTGNEAELGDLKGMSFKVYKDISENILKLTGQDKKQQIVSGEVVHKMEVPANKPISTKDAANILKIVDAEFKKE